MDDLTDWYTLRLIEAEMAQRKLSEELAVTDELLSAKNVELLALTLENRKLQLERTKLLERLENPMVGVFLLVFVFVGSFC